MPNWTTNTLIIKGHPRTLAKVEVLLKGKPAPIKSDISGFSSEPSEEPLLLNNLLPCPEELMNDDWQRDKEIAAANTKKFGHSGWYDWRVANWGTKWEVGDASFTKKHGELGYGFDTAWSPPLPWVAALSKRFPSLTLTLEYHEEGGMFPSAVETYKDGEKIGYEEIPNINLEEEEEEG